MGFVSKLFGANNDFNATGATNLQTSDYQKQISDALKQAGVFNPNLVNNQQANDTAQSQGQLAQMLMKQAQGQGGPSPAQNLLTQASNQNTANSAAQLAGVRGMNPAAAARLIMQGGAAQGQQLANQAGVLQANQQLQAQNQLSGLLGTQRSQDINQAQGNTAAGLQGINANTNLLGTLGGLQNQQNAGQIQNALGAEQINAGVATGNSQTNAGVGGGILGALSGASATSALGGGKWRGGEIKGYADGGDIFQGSPLDAMSDELPVGPDSVGGGAMAGVDAGSQVIQDVPQEKPNEMAQTPGAAPQVPQYGGNPNSYAGGYALGKGLMGPGLSGAMNVGKAMFSFLKDGGNVPGSAKVSGDSPKNDTVPAILSPGETVLPRSVTQADDAPERAKEFMKALKKHHAEATGPQGYAKVLAAHRNLDARMKELEKLAYGGVCG